MINIAVSGGYNLVSQESADKESLFKLFDDTLKKRNNKSIVLPRSIAGNIDDSKFMWSLLDGVPIAGVSQRNIMVPGIQYAALGNADQQKVTDSLNTTTSLENILFVPERKPGSKLHENWSDIGAKLGADNNHFVIKAADTPLSFNVYKALLNEFIEKYDLFINLNTKQALCGLFDRNFYDFVKSMDGEVLPWKEPNEYGFNMKGLNAAVPLMEDLYSGRRGGNQASAIYPIFFRQWKEHPEFSKEFLKVAKYLAVRKYARDKTPNHALDVKEASNFVSAMLYNSSAKAFVSGSHRDPFRIRDIDGLHDWAFYRAIFEAVALRSDGTTDFRKLKEIYPHAEDIEKMREHLESYDLAIVSNFKDFVSEKIERLNTKLGNFTTRYETELRKYHNKHYKKMSWDKFISQAKALESYSIPKPFKNGRINLELVHPNEHKAQNEIYKTQRFLKNYNAQFYQDQKTFSSR